MHFVEELEVEVGSFLAASPFELLAAEDASTGDLVYRVKIRQQPPVSWSLLIADAIHNARCALDQLAWRLVETDGGKPGDGTYFPIADAEVGYGGKLRSGLAGAKPETRASVKALQPWKGGDDDLWRLHRLDIIDKHRLLIPVGAALRGILLNMTLPGFEFDGGKAIRFPTLELLVADRQYPLKDGAEVFRIMKAARDGSAADAQHGVTFEVAFGEGLVVAGEPIAPTVRDLVSHAKATTEPLAVAVA